MHGQARFRTWESSPGTSYRMYRWIEPPDWNLGIIVEAIPPTPASGTLEASASISAYDAADASYDDLVGTDGSVSEEYRKKVCNPFDHFRVRSAAGWKFRIYSNGVLQAV